MPLVSIIIPSFNSVHFLQECIDSVKSQSFKDYEVIIMDGESTDGTVDFLKSLNEPFFWRSEPDEGIYDAMNKGIEMSKGDWLYFLGCDDRLLGKDTLKSIFAKNIQKQTSLIIGKVQYDYSLEDSMLIKKNGGVFNPSWSFKIWIKNAVHHQGVFYRRDVFKLKQYSLEYKILSDYDFNLALYKQGVSVLLMDQIVAVSKTIGISKKYHWSLYMEEIDLKSNQSSIIFRPIFYALGFFKYLLKRVI